MDGFMRMFLSLSLSGAVLTIVLLLCKPLYKNRLSQRWQYYIWLVVIARLLLPFTTGSDIADSWLGRLPRSDTQIKVEESISPVKDVQEGQDPAIRIRAAPRADNSAASEKYPLKEALYGLLSLLRQNLFFIWLIPAIALFIRKITEYQSFMGYLNAGRAEISDLHKWEQLGGLLEESGIRVNVKIYANSLVSSPLLIGFFHPYIILPSAEIQDTDFKNTIRHELVHLKRKDMLYKWLVQMICCLHWFDPFIYILSHEASRLCELSCDEAVIQKLDGNGRKEYGDTLLNAIATGNAYRCPPASVAFNEGFKDGKKLLKERLDVIMKFKKKTVFGTVVSVLSAFLLCAAAVAVGDTIIHRSTVDSQVASKSISTDQTIDSTKNKKQRSSKKEYRYDHNAINKYIADGKVLFDDDRYYILCGGATEKDRPSGCSDPYAMVWVKKNGYAVADFDLATAVKDIKESCEEWVEEKVLTKKQAELGIGLAAKLQSGNGKVEGMIDISKSKEYVQWGIKRKNGSYYYGNELVRVLLEVKHDDSLKSLDYDKNGTVNIKIKRNKKGKVSNVKEISDKAADKYL